MHIDIQTSDMVLTEGLAAHVEQRLLFALGRFQAHVARVAVHLSHVNGPAGVDDGHCHLQVRLHGLPDIVAEDTETDLYVAVDRAAERAGRTLGRQLRRAGGIFDDRSAWGNYEPLE